MLPLETGEEISRLGLRQQKFKEEEEQIIVCSCIGMLLQKQQQQFSSFNMMGEE